MRKKSRERETKPSPSPQPLLVHILSFLFRFDAGHTKWIISISSLHGKFTQFSISLSMFAVCTHFVFFPVCSGMPFVRCCSCSCYSQHGKTLRQVTISLDILTCLCDKSSSHSSPLAHTLSSHEYPSTRSHSFIHTVLIVFRSSFFTSIGH